MDRPDRVYLQEPIELAGIIVQHTYEGLLYMIDHYTQVLAMPLSEQQLKYEHRQYIQKLIDNYNIHLQLYEHDRGPKTVPTPEHLPANQADDPREEEVPNRMAEVLDRGDGTDSR